MFKADKQIQITAVVKLKSHKHLPMKNIILFFILTIGIGTVKAQTQSSVSLIHNFMRDIINPRINEDVIIDTYLCRYLHDAPDKATNKNYVFARGQITGIREYMHKENVKAEQLKIYKYHDIPSKDQNVSFEENDDVYACYYNSSLFNFFIVSNDRIDAFNTMNKAGQRFFISHCR